MNETLDDFVKELQEQIHQETKEAYGEIAFQRWLNPLYMGALDDPDGYARLTGTCGDTMEIFLCFRDDRVREARFRTDGCGSSVVCASFAAEMSREKTPDEILDITGDAIIEKLGGLPESERHCAFLAAETLQEAIHDYMMRQAKKGAKRTDEQLP
ncbi:MAG: iron-sulfur cluster assembly scaffold protein [Deltaproteobacteria bacterium]|nr:iron-sulfur cluster assembly scaffold protein [Deltaproteobacteria bacterium]